MQYESEQYGSMEEELCALTKVDPTKYANRQDFLARLIRSIEKLPDPLYDGMTEYAFQWFKQGVLHLNHRKNVPEFPDSSLADPNGSTLAVSLEDMQAESRGILPGNEGAGATADDRASGRELPPRRVPDYASLSGEKDRFGITIGTNTHEAVKMYIKGCTAKDVEQALGGRYRNILRKLADEGHIVEKLGGGMYRITHKDDNKI